MTEINTTEQLTLFGPEMTEMMDRIEGLRNLGLRYKELVLAHDRLATIMAGNMTSASVDFTGNRRGSARVSTTTVSLDKHDIQTVLELMHKRILDDMKAAFEKLQAHKDTI